MAIDNFKPMECPICHKYYFTENTNLEETNYCRHCGWKYDLLQYEYPEVGHLTNELSLNEYKKWYKKKLAKNPNYDYTNETRNYGPHNCPVCGKYKFQNFGSFDICPYCGWEDDPLMEDEPDKWASCANPLCLNDYRKEYQKLIKENPNYKWKTDHKTK